MLALAASCTSEAPADHYPLHLQYVCAASETEPSHTRRSPPVTTCGRTRTRLRTRASVVPIRIADGDHHTDQAAKYGVARQAARYGRPGCLAPDLTGTMSPRSDYC